MDKASSGLLAGNSNLKRDALFWHYPHYSNQGGRPGGAVRSGNYKLIEHYEDGRWELFDLAADPSETTNLAETSPKVAVDLDRKLEAWRRSVGAEMPRPNPDYRPVSTTQTQ
jgi:arylsulfatase A